MSKLNNTIKTIAVGAIFAFATPAFAHNVVSDTVTVPVIAAGGSATLTITCPHHHYAIAGGFGNEGDGAWTGSIDVTANYPQSTRTWAVEVTNRSGRPTGAQQFTGTLYVTCDHHW